MFNQIFIFQIENLPIWQWVILDGNKLLRMFEIKY